MRVRFWIGFVLVFAQALVSFSPAKKAFAAIQPGKVKGEDYLKFKEQKRLSETGWLESSEKSTSVTAGAFASGAAIGSDMHFIKSNMSPAEVSRVLEETKLSSSVLVHEFPASADKGHKIVLMGNDWRVRTIAASLKKSLDAANLMSIFKTVRTTIATGGNGSAVAALPELSSSDSVEVARSKTASIARILKELQLFGFRSLSRARVEPSKGTRPFEVLCYQRETGSGNGSDSSGHGITTEFRAARLFKEAGVISNLEWPLKDSLSCVKDQGRRGTSTAFATVAAVESAVERADGSQLNLSEQAVHFYGKAFLDKTTAGQDELVSQLLLDASLAGYKLPVEKDWSYNPSPLRKPDFTGSCDGGYQEFCSATPSQGKIVCADGPDQRQCGLLSQIESNDEGVQVKAYDSIWDFGAVDESARLAIHYLQNKIPLILDIIVTDGFLVAPKGYVKMPQSEDRKLGGQSLELVGYASVQALKSKIPGFTDGGSEGYFIGKNSWGPGVGDGGYYYIPLEYLKKYAVSVLAVKEVEVSLGEGEGSSSPESRRIQEMGNLGNIF